MLRILGSLARQEGPEQMQGQRQRFLHRTSRNIARANLDGSNPETIVHLYENPIFPYNLALDLETDKLYAAGGGGILVADLDGTILGTLFFGELFATGIAIDHSCGDGKVDPGEECDDGNNLPGDGCEPDCTETPQVPAASPGGAIVTALLLLISGSILLLRRARV